VKDEAPKGGVAGRGSWGGTFLPESGKKHPCATGGPSVAGPTASGKVKRRGKGGRVKEKEKKPRKTKHDGVRKKSGAAQITLRAVKKKAGETRE